MSAADSEASSIVASSQGGTTKPKELRNAGWRNELRAWLAGASRVAVLGLGNPIRTDDCVGVRIVQELRGRTSPNVLLVECETVPEGYTNDIIAFNPTHVLLVDAALIGLPPGGFELRGYEGLPVEATLSSHTLPIGLLCEGIDRLGHAKVSLILVQPKDCDFGEWLTPEVAEAADAVTRLLLEALP
ncbi:MAG TPA: hydrogenase maturation protease [Methanomassiliicoccales archaeon]|nr:hydrogenase maturation protease [Methanomassiliicoccales archaeon]